MKPLLNAFLLLTTLFCAFSVSAKYDSNTSGVVTSVLTYTGNDRILIKLDKMPEHPSCNASFFAVDGSLPAERRQQILARLLTAFATGKKPI